jgi:hypothetical protein
MNAPNFSAVAAQLRDERDAAEWDRRQREKWLARPLNKREAVIFDELLLALRGFEARSEFSRDDAAFDVADHFAGAGDGHEDWLELLRAVAEEEPKAALAALKRALRSGAKVRHEWEC